MSDARFSVAMSTFCNVGPALLIFLISVASANASENGRLRVPDRTSLSPATAPPVSVADLIGFARLGSDETVYARQNAPGAPFLSQSRDQIIWSPDGERVAMVVHRGNNKSNTVDYELIQFRAKELRNRPKAEQLVEFSSSSPRAAIRSVRWMDDKTLVFLGERPAELPQVYTVDIRTKKVSRKTNSPTKICGFDISTDGAIVVYESARAYDPELKRRETARGFTLKDNASLEFLMADKYNGTGFSDAYLPCDLWRVEGGGQPSLLNLDSWAIERLQNVRQHRYYLSPRGDWLLMHSAVKEPPTNWSEYRVQGKEFDYKHAEQWILVRMRDGRARALIDAPIPPGTSPAGGMRASPYQGQVLWAPDGQSVLISDAWLPLSSATPEQREQRVSALYAVEVDLNSGALTEIERFEPGTIMLADYWRASDGTARLERWQKKERGEILFGGVHYPVTEWIRDDRRSYRYTKAGGTWIRLASLDRRPLIEIEQGENLPPRVVALDARSKHKTIVLDPNPGFVSQHRFAVATPIEWSYGDGKRMSATLYWPPDYKRGKRYPLVVQGHGYRPNMFEPLGNITGRRHAAQPLANAGIFVVQYSEGGDGWDQYDFATYKPTAFASLESLIDLLDGNGLIHRSQVGLSGYSTDYGFFMHFMTHSSYPVAAASLGEGVDFGYFAYLSVYSADDTRFGWERLNGGMPWGPGRTAWLSRAPGFNLDGFNTPIQFEAGASEDYSEAMTPGLGLGSVLVMWENYQGLRLLGKPVEFVLLPEATHDRGPPWSTYTSQQGAVDWLRFWLQDYQRVVPCAEVGETTAQLVTQYARWGILRERQNRAGSSASHSQDSSQR